MYHDSCQTEEPMKNSKKPEIVQKVRLLGNKTSDKKKRKKIFKWKFS